MKRSVRVNESSWCKSMKSTLHTFSSLAKLNADVQWCGSLVFCLLWTILLAYTCIQNWSGSTWKHVIEEKEMKIKMKKKLQTLKSVSCRQPTYVLRKRHTTTLANHRNPSRWDENFVVGFFLYFCFIFECCSRLF